MKVGDLVRFRTSFDKNVYLVTWSDGLWVKLAGIDYDPNCRTYIRSLEKIQ